jgi:hypothetical protein
MSARLKHRGGAFDGGDVSLAPTIASVTSRNGVFGSDWVAASPLAVF